MAYEKCADVSQEIWKELEERDPAEVTGRTGVIFQDGMYHLPFLERELLLDPARREVRLHPAAPGDPGFRACLSALSYLLHLDPKALGPCLSPLALPGGATFFRGHHGLPDAPLADPVRPGSGRLSGRRPETPGGDPAGGGCRPGLAGLSRADGGGNLVAGG